MDDGEIGSDFGDSEPGGSNNNDVRRSILDVRAVMMIRIAPSSGGFNFPGRKVGSLVEHL